MEYELAYDRDKNIEYFLYSNLILKDNFYCSTMKPMCSKNEIGALLLQFLNTNFEDINELTSFISTYCFQSFYCEKNYIKCKLNTYINLSLNDYNKEIKCIALAEQKTFIYIKHLFLYYLNLPYNIEILEKDNEESSSDMSDKAKENLSNEKIILPLFNINLDFDMMNFLFAGEYTSDFNVPYAFRSPDIYSILSLELKEFLSMKKHVIRKCQNCGRYFIPNNLKEIKYCSEINTITGKSCRQVGRNLAYKESLKKDRLLNLYRKRYMSLASSVSHYGTDTSIERFEKYKTEGAVMKSKYQNNQISALEFEQWIDSSKSILR